MTYWMDRFKKAINGLRRMGTYVFVATLSCAVLSGCIQDEELEKAHTKAKKELRTLKKDNRKMSRDLKKMVKANGLLEAQIESAQSDLTKVQSKMLKFKSAAGEAESVKEDLEKEIKTLNSQIAKLKKAKKKKIWAKVHYWRPDMNYYNWGVHTKGLAVQRSTSWSDPVRFKYLTAFGAYAKFELHKDHKKHPLKFLVHNGGEIDLVPDREDDKSAGLGAKEMEVSLAEQREIWVVSGDQSIYFSKSDGLAAKQKAIDKLKKAAEKPEE